ncbi:MAG: Fe-S protein assembly co-chaperone HscB [Bacteroidia bacterium]|nr:Fe-S protein assembly co-chaperone HscB [Bacteroidia bacterium]
MDTADNYFSILGIAVSMDISDEELRQSYLKCSRETHPDLNTADSREKARLSTALLNTAYQTLKNPISRAKYILTLRGQDINLPIEKNVLTASIELNMEIEDALQTADTQKIEALKYQIQAKINQIIDGIVKHLAMNAPEENILAAKKIAEVKYFLRTQEKLSTFAP